MKKVTTTQSGSMAIAALSLIITALLLSTFLLYSSETPAQPTNDPNITVEKLNLVNKKRVSRTDYEYTYTVDISNSGSDAENVTATLTSNIQSTVVIDGDVSFGSVPSGNTRTSTDTITIKQNRRVPFDPSSLIWDINYTTVNLPPDPGEAGKETILGIDSDSDGVRDDIQRYIYFSFPDNAQVRMVLTRMSKEYQGILSNPTDHDANFNYTTRLARHGECLFYILGEDSLDVESALKAEILNTVKRSRAYITYSDSLAGSMIANSPKESWANSCNFDANTTGDN